MNTSTQTTIAIASAVALSFFIYSHNQRKRRKQLPPSPPQNFFFGNMKDVPSQGDMWVQHRDIAAKLDSDWVNFNVMGNNLLVLNSYEAANDLLDKRGLTYSGRPRMVMLNELMGWDWNLSLMDSENNRFVAVRRLLTQQLQTSVVSQTYHSIIRQGVMSLLKNLLDDPQDYRRYFRYMNSWLILMIVYGHQVDPTDDKYVKLINSAAMTAIEAHGYKLIGLFPYLKHLPEWFPGAGFKRLARKACEISARIRGEPHDMVKERMAAGTATPCLTSLLLEDESTINVKTFGLDREEIVKDCASTLYGAGVETTFFSLMVFVLCMLRNPEVQGHAHEEFDCITNGETRLPDFTDRPNMPYTEALLKEVMRWHPTAPIGVPHRATKDDVYRDKLIPKNTTVMANAWAMMHDPEVYESPDAFMPERFLPRPGKAPEPDPQRAVFGFGRRICPGRHFADAVMWMTIVTVLATFEILPPLDENGKEIEQDISLKESWSTAPSTFKCTFKPRSEDVVKLVQLEV